MSSAIGLVSLLAAASFAYCVNHFADREDDSPENNPITAGYASANTVLMLATFSLMVSLLGALVVSDRYFIYIGVLAILNYLYNVEPFRLKRRAPFDIIVVPVLHQNIVMMCGAELFSLFPPTWLLCFNTLVGISATLLVEWDDYDDDKAHDLNTTAVFLDVNTLFWSMFTSFSTMLWAVLICTQVPTASLSILLAPFIIFYAGWRATSGGKAKDVLAMCALLVLHPIYILVG